MPDCSLPNTSSSFGEFDRREFLATSSAGLNALTHLSVPSLLSTFDATTGMTALGGITGRLVSSPVWKLVECSRLLSFDPSFFETAVGANRLDENEVQDAYTFLLSSIRLERNGEMAEFKSAFNELMSNVRQSFEYLNGDLEAVRAIDGPDAKLPALSEADVFCNLVRAGMPPRVVGRLYKFFLELGTGAHWTQPGYSRGNFESMRSMQFSDHFTAALEFNRDMTVRLLGYIRGVKGDKFLNDVREKVEAECEPFERADLRRLEGRGEYERARQGNIDVEHPFVLTFRHCFGTDLAQVYDFEPRSKARAWITTLDSLF